MAGQVGGIVSFGHAGSDLLYGVPFAGLLLSIAILPTLVPRWWEHRFGTVTAFWTILLLIPFAALQDWRTAAHGVMHAIALEYVPFILLVFSLFVVAGGVRIVGNLIGDPKTNTLLLLCGTVLASVLGTTGAAMLLIRPLIRANEDRRHATHVFVFFIFLVANIGGALTPLGDPPLFLGFLRGVDFFWTVGALWKPTTLTAGVLLVLFIAIDAWQWRKDREAFPESHMPRRIRIEGMHNAAYLAVIVGVVLLSGLWRSGVTIPIGFGVEVMLEGLVRDVVLLAVGLLSWKSTNRRVRIENAFTWVPIQEVAVLFLGIFITIVPVLGILRAGAQGPAAPILAAVYDPAGLPREAAFFWITGLLSSVLDNAPTYLIFFDLAGSDAASLMGPLHRTLLAISMGAVFMGALTYLGNAPNLMIKAICEDQRIRMPSFFGYIAWSAGILMPIFAALTWIFL